MASQAPNYAQAPTLITPLPAWALERQRELPEADAAFAAGIALKTLDDLVRARYFWAGCWRSRRGLACASSGLRLQGRNLDEAALRDAVLLTAAGDNCGPAGNAVLAYRRLASRKPDFSSKTIAELAKLLGLPVDQRMTDVVDFAESALQSGRTVPFATADFVSQYLVGRPEAEPLAWALADMLIAAMLKWERPVPLLMAERFGRAYQTLEGRGRVRPGEAGFSRAICLAIFDAVAAALRSASGIARRANLLREVAPKLRTRGADAVIQCLLESDAILASAPKSNLSRWAATRLFERLESYGAVRELTGRSSFRIYGL